MFFTRMQWILSQPKRYQKGPGLIKFDSGVSYTIYRTQKYSSRGNVTKKRLRGSLRRKLWTIGNKNCAKRPLFYHHWSFSNLHLCPYRLLIPFGQLPGFLLSKFPWQPPKHWCFQAVIDVVHLFAIGLKKKMVIVLSQLNVLTLWRTYPIFFNIVRLYLL